MLKIANIERAANVDFRGEAEKVSFLFDVCIGEERFAEIIESDKPFDKMTMKDFYALLQKMTDLMNDHLNPPEEGEKEIVDGNDQPE